MTALIDIALKVFGIYAGLYLSTLWQFERWSTTGLVLLGLFIAGASSRGLVALAKDAA